MFSLNHVIILLLSIHNLFKIKSNYPMKKHFTFIFALTFFVLTSCKNDKPKEGTDKNVTDSTTTKTESEETKSNTGELEKGKFHFDYPVTDKLDAANGDKVFAIDMAVYLADLKAGNPSIKASLINATIKEVGEKESTVLNAESYKVPNSGIVIIPKGQTAKVGDFVAGKWNGVMMLGYVTNASNPKSPKVTFLGLDWDNPAKADDRKTTVGQFEYTLKENEFMVVSKDFDPGTMCAIKSGKEWRLMDIFNSKDDKVMGVVYLDFKSANKSDCVPIPLKGNFKVSDQVYAPWMSTMFPGKITKIDSKMGRITVKFDDKVKGEKTVSFGQVIKDLPK